jgi:hypothetical protein
LIRTEEKAIVLAILSYEERILLSKTKNFMAKQEKFSF